MITNTKDQKQSRISAEMALQRKLRELLIASGYRRPLDIRYIRRANGAPIDAAVVYRPDGSPAILVVRGDDWRWVN